MRFAPKPKPQRRPRRRAVAHAEPLHHGCDMPPHGTQIGRILIEYRGQRAEAVLLQAGRKCRTHGVSINGEPVMLLGLYRAAALVSAAVQRMPGGRSDLWRDAPVSARDEADAAAAQEMMG